MAKRPFGKVALGGVGDLLPAAAPIETLPAYEFLQVNGFVYRCNKVTGEMWRLEASAKDKKVQVWKKVEDVHAA